MFRLHLGPLQSKVQCADRAVLLALQAQMAVRRGRFVPDQGRLAGAQRASEWNWNSYTHFLRVSSARSHPMPTGFVPTLLVDELHAFAAKRGLAVEVVSDARVSAPDWLDDSLLESALVKHLRPYQLQALADIVQAKMGVVKMATGGGKTLVFATLIKLVQLRDPSVRVLVLFRNVSLVQQALGAMEQVQVQSLGCVHGTSLQTDANVLLSTVQSFHRIPQAHLDATAVLVADECHLFTSPSSVKALKAVPNTFLRLGFSGTPWKEDDERHNKMLHAWFGPEICNISTQELTAEHKVLSKAVCVFYNLSRKSLALWNATYHEAYVEGCVKNDELNRKIVDLVSKLNGRILVLVKRLAHGETLATMMAARGSAVDWISGSDSLEDRERILNKLRHSNERRCVAILSSIGSTGIDVHVHHLVNAAGGVSPIVTIQSIGRGLRQAHDKTQLHYYDFVNRSNYHLELHSRARMETLASEGHAVTVARD